jgi:multidrug resistance efflux pump
MPVKLNVLAPGELVPSNPFVVSAPLDGVVGDFYVKPNQNVKAGTPLFSLDDTTLYSRLDVARQTLATAEAAYRQSAQMAVFDPRAKVQLASLMGKIAEQRAEVSYVINQLKRTTLVAPADGMALFDDPTEWIGKPVTTGEPIMRIAEVEDKEIEAWLAVADAVPLEQGAPVKFYLSASPLHPVEGKVRYMAYEAVQRPDGTYAYRVRASLTSETAYRLGLKGTVKVEGEQVRLAYWVLRRPWSVLRQYLGV